MKSYIWGLPTRLFHWLLVITLVVAYILGDEEELLKMHTAFGYFIGILLVFRLLWGLIGPKYSKFSDFPVGLKSIKNGISELKSGENKYVGHNPLASLVMLGIISMGLAVVFTGMMTLAAKGYGFIPNLCPGMKPHDIKEIHELTVNILIGFAILHLFGLIADKVKHGKIGTLQSMFSGYKNVDAELVKITTFQSIFTTIWILTAAIAFACAVLFQNIVIKEKHEKEDKEKTEHSVEKDDD